jgi:hypothetical protein
MQANRTKSYRSVFLWTLVAGIVAACADGGTSDTGNGGMGPYDGGDESNSSSSSSGSSSGSGSGSGSSSGMSSSSSSSGGGTCPAHCSSNTDCNTCPPVNGGTNCCDTGSGVCYATTMTCTSGSSGGDGSAE